MCTPNSLFLAPSKIYTYEIKDAAQIGIFSWKALQCFSLLVIKHIWIALLWPVPVWTWEDFHSASALWPLLSHGWCIDSQPHPRSHILCCGLLSTMCLQHLCLSQKPQTLTTSFTRLLKYDLFIYPVPDSRLCIRFHNQELLGFFRSNVGILCWGLRPPCREVQNISADQYVWHI